VFSRFPKKQTHTEEKLISLKPLCWFRGEVKVVRVLELKDLKCPYCGSRKIESWEEIRFCCLFGHGERTLDQLGERASELLKVRVWFECRECSREFYLIYKPVAIEKA